MLTGSGPPGVFPESPVCSWLDTRMHPVTHWYTSGTFWAAAAVVVGIIVGGLTLLVTYLVGTTGRKLIYGMPTATPLPAVPPGVSSDIEVRHGERVLVNPQVLEVRLKSGGRKDIRSSDFDGGKPLRLDIGIPIVSLLGWTMDPEGASTGPDVWVRGSGLEIDPSLIPRHQVFTFHLLADGEKPCLTCECPLSDVKVYYLHYPDFHGMEPKLAIFGGLIVYSALLPLAAVVAGLVMRIPVLIVAGFYTTLTLMCMSAFASTLGAFLESREQRKRLVRSLRSGKYLCARNLFMAKRFEFVPMGYHLIMHLLRSLDPAG